MRMDRLTNKFQMALSEAQSLAVGRDHQFIEPIHLMIALLDQQGRHPAGKAVITDGLKNVKHNHQQCAADDGTHRHGLGPHPQECQRIAG